MPLVTRPWLAAAQLGGILRTKLQAPLSDGFIADKNAPLGEEFLDVEEAQGKPVVQPERVTNDLGRVAIIAGVGIRWWFHPMIMPAKRPLQSS